MILTTDPDAECNLERLWFVVADARVCEGVLGGHVGSHVTPVLMRAGVVG